MSAYGETLNIELAADYRQHETPARNGFLGRIGQKILRTLRTAAWDVLDLHTEFDPLD